MCDTLFANRLYIRVSKFSKNLFREIFEAHSKIIYFREISTIFIIIFAKMFSTSSTHINLVWSGN